MTGSQLPLFQRKSYKGIIPTIPVEIQAPGTEKTVLETLPAYYTYLTHGGFSKYTPDDFTGDLKKFGVFLKEKKIQAIKDRDIQSWISFLKAPSPRGEGLSSKTVSRKLTALGNYFQRLVGNAVIPADKNPMLTIANFRVSSPLPEILFETECSALLTTASRSMCGIRVNNFTGVIILKIWEFPDGVSVTIEFLKSMSRGNYPTKVGPGHITEHHESSLWWNYLLASYLNDCFYVSY